MYRLYSDKTGTFKCKIDVKGASLEKSKTRLIFENEDINVSFKGTVDSHGNCEIPIKKLKNLIGESCEGTVKLEVIVEDNYFEPWSDSFKAIPSKELTVEVKSFLDQIANKPKVLVVEQNNNVDTDYHLTILQESFEENGLKKKMLTKESLPSFTKSVLEYCDKMGITDKKSFTKNLLHRLK